MFLKLFSINILPDQLCLLKLTQLLDELHVVDALLLKNAPLLGLHVKKSQVILYFEQM